MSLSNRDSESLPDLEKIAEEAESLYAARIDDLGSSGRKHEAELARAWADGEPGGAIRMSAILKHYEELDETEAEALSEAPTAKEMHLRWADGHIPTVARTLSLRLKDWEHDHPNEAENVSELARSGEYIKALNIVEDVIKDLAYTGGEDLADVHWGKVREELSFLEEHAIPSSNNSMSP